jgi:hypothetical protein
VHYSYINKSVLGSCFFLLALLKCDSHISDITDVWSDVVNEAESYRVLAQHSGLPGWLEESDPAGVILYVMNGPYCLPFPYHTGCPDRSCPAAS